MSNKQWLILWLGLWTASLVIPFVPVVLLPLGIAKDWVLYAPLWTYWLLIVIGAYFMVGWLPVLVVLLRMRKARRA